MPPLIISAVVREGDVHVTDYGYQVRRQKAARKWGDGTVLTIRIEPEEDAWRHADAKWLYGYCYAPVSAKHGETVAEVHMRMKAQFMPDDGRTSITELNREEMRAFIESVEQDIRENDPESWEDCVAKMSLYEGKRTA